MNYLEEIKKALKNKGVKTDVNKTTQFSSLGLDSLDIMDMVIVLEEKTGVTFSDEALLEILTVGDLLTEIQKLVEAK